MQTFTKYTPEQIRNLFDLLAAKCRAGLIEGDEFRAERKHLYELAHESIRSVSVKHGDDCPFCAEERAAERARMDNSILMTAGSGQKSEKIRGIRI